MDRFHASCRRLPSPLIWVIGSLPVLMLFVRDWQMLHDGLLVGPSETWGRDFANMWTGGTLALRGRLDILYDLAAYRAFETTLYGRLAMHNYSYPPIALFLNVPLALMPYWLALATWLTATGLLFVEAARPWCRGPARWLLLLAPAATMNIWAGHYGFLIGALFLLGWRWLEERPRLAGVCFGLMVLKPHLAVLVPLVLLLRGEWRTIAAAALTVGVLVAASIVAFGAPLWHQYLTVTTGVQAGMIDPGAEFYGLMATSLVSGLLRQGVPAALAWGLQGLAMAATVTAVVVATLRGTPPKTLALLVGTGTFVILPYAFNYDLTVVAVAALSLAARRHTPPFSQPVALVAFVAPQLGMPAAAMGLPLLPVALILLFCVQAVPIVAPRLAETARAALSGRGGRAGAAAAR